MQSHCAFMQIVCIKLYTCKKNFKEGRKKKRRKEE